MAEKAPSESTDIAILERLRAVPSAVLADAMEVLKLPDAVLPASVRCLASEKFAGRARTLLKAPRPANATQQDVAPGKAGDLYDLIDSCKAGDVIATLEAMKMEAALHAPRDGKVGEILVAPGQQVDAKDLVLVFA